MNRTLAPKSLEGILGETFTIYKNNLLRLISIVAIVQVPIVVLYIIAFSLMPMPTYGGLEPETPSPLMLFIWIPIGFALFAASICMVGAVIHTVAQQYFYRPVSIGRAYSSAWRRLGDMFWGTVLVYLALVGICLVAILISVIIVVAISGNIYGLYGWLIGIVIACMIISIVATPPILYLGTNWNFLLQTALLEGCGSRAALSRSWALVKGSWWRVFGIILLLVFILQTIVMIFTMPGMMGYFSETMSNIASEAPAGFTHYATSGFPTWVIWAVIGGALGDIISIPIFVIGQTLLYFDLRVRKQGYSLDAMANELGLRSTT